MVVRRIHRYLAREILGPTLLCLLAFTMVLLMGRLVRLVDLVINKGVSLLDIGILVAGMAPSFLTITLPLAFLMGMMIGLGRLSADNETVALKASGVSLANLAVPVLALAVGFALLTGTIGIWGKAWGYRTFKAKVFAITQHKATVGFQPRVFMDQFSGLVLYANEMQERRGEMEGLFIREQQPGRTSLIFARHGKVLTDPGQETVVLRLQDGVIHHHREAGGRDYQLVRFERYDIRPDLGADLNADGENDRDPRRKIKPKELPFPDLMAAIGESPAGEKLNALRSELHQRLLSPVAPLLFALFGLPFSIQSQRSGRSGGFLVGLAIYLAYYVLWSVADTLTSEAGISPWLSFWLPHGLLFVGGGYLLWQASRGRRNLLVRSIDHWSRLLARRIKRA